MKYLCLACALLAAPAALLAQLGVGGGSDDQQQQQQPPEEMPDFSGLNEYIYVPKTTLYFGDRILTGAKTSFTGSGFIGAPEPLPDPTVALTNESNTTNTYHDGAVAFDDRMVTIAGSGVSVPIAPDGKTDKWSYTNSSQLTSDDYMQFHNYSASLSLANPASKRGETAVGLELAMARDMGNIGSKLSWNIVAGVSLNDIHAHATQVVPATVTTVTDTYNLYGVVPPSGVYTFSGGSTAGVDVYNNGNTTTDSSGATTQTTVNTDTLIGNKPLNRTTSTALDSTDIKDTWSVRGAYLMFRVGPQFNFNFTDHLRLSVSFGPALIYSGTTYDVTEAFKTPTGDPIVDNLTETTERLVPAGYADATLQYLVTDTTGLYVGAVYQTGGSYKQTDDQKADSNSAGSSAVYTTKVDFGNEQGLRTGLTFKF